MASIEPVPEPVRRDDGMPTSAEERHLRRLLALRAAMPHTYYDDGEAQGIEHGISIDFMREPVAHIDAKLRALNVARAIAKQAGPVQEPVAWWKRHRDGSVELNDARTFVAEDAIATGRRPLIFGDTAPPQRPAQPPQDHFSDATKMVQEPVQETEMRRCPRCWEPMFPPQRKPLAWAERRALWRESTFRGNGGQMDWFIEGTRAAERAHGIVGKA